MSEYRKDRLLLSNLVSNLKSNAKGREIDVILNNEELMSLFDSAECHWCGISAM